MITVYDNGTCGVPTSSSQVYSYTLNPKFKCDQHDRQKHAEVVKWVQENVKGGFWIRPGQAGYIDAIRIEREEDYLMYLLKWQYR